MATKIKRCLYVGLGGTGMSALLNTKKTFLETYGEIPPMIGFLGIDTDGGEYKKELESKYGKVSLSPNEQLPIRVDDARPIYEVSKEHFNWLQEENLYALTSMTLGAGQVRTNGRFALTVNYKDVENKISSLINSITQATITNNPKYELLASNVEIHLIFSVCGGTGCGTFINVAYLLRKCAPSSKITGYGILPDVFEAMSSHGMAKVKPNAYGAIQDLDWLMHLNLNSDKVVFDYINSVQETNDKPFNAFFFVDNKNSNNDTYMHVEQLAEMVSLALVTSAGELSTAAASVSDNLEKNIREGSMNIENKKAWVAGLGVCEIMYHGEDLKELYASKAVQHVVERLLNGSCVDTNTIVNAWIDSENVNIRENNGYDNVINFLLSKQPPYPFTSIDDKSNPANEVDSYVKSSLPKDGEVDKRVKELKERVGKELRILIKKEINQECGVGACESILSDIANQVDIFLGEMRDEVEVLKEQLPKIESSLKIAIKDLVDLNGKFFKRRNTLEEFAAVVTEIAMNKVRCERDIIRHNGAIAFYNALKVELLETYEKVKAIKSLLVAVSEDMATAIAEKQNYVGRESQIFQIDLAKEEVLQLSVNSNEILIPELLKTLPSEDRIYDFGNKRKDEVAESLLKYTRQLRTAKELGSRTIDEMLDKMSDEEFEHLIQTSINKSNPLLRFDYRGYTPQERPAQSFYIGVPDKKNSRLCKGDAFKNMLQGDIDVDFSNIGVKDRVIVYRQVGVYPAYCIAPLSSYKEKYDNCNCFCHFDANIYRKMQREDYNIYPRIAADDSLELWVKGFIFGLVKNEDDLYHFRSEELGDALDDNWVELTKYRDDAFAKFKTYKNIVRKEFNEYFAKYQKTKGIDNMQSLIDAAKENYFDGFSQIQMTKDEIKQKGNEAIRKLITQELEFVKKEL